MKYYIYQIISNCEQFCYIGSTKKLNERIRKHREVCYNNSEKNRKYNMKIYKTIRDNGGWENFTHNVLEEIETNDENEVKKLEQDWITIIKPNMNSAKASSGFDNFKDYVSNWHKENWKNNKEKEKERRKKWLENGGKEWMKNYMKNYYQENN